MQPGQAFTGLSARLRAIVALLGEVAHTRLALLAAEVDALVSASLRALLAGLAALALATLALLSALVAMLIAVPDSFRAHAAAIVALVLAIVALALFRWVARLSRISAFSASLDEVHRDLSELRNTAAPSRSGAAGPRSTNQPSSNPR